MIPHLLLFLLLALISSLVYHALRVENVRDAAVAGLKRFLSCVVITVIGSIVLQLFTRWV
jgi:hypothetical protein